MTTNRENLLGKIRALLSKTMDNGCTEQEAMAALDRAQAMMDAYEVTDSELNLTKEEKASIRKGWVNDGHNIAWSLCHGVGKFTNCQLWGRRTGVRGQRRIMFCGLPSDVDFAEWLLDSLSNFVRAELTEYMYARQMPPNQKRKAINGFVFGCAKRITERMDEITARSRQAASTNSRALVVVKDAAVRKAMAEAGIHLASSSSSRRSADADGYAAGKAAGDRASFGRPVGGKSQLLLK